MVQPRLKRKAAATLIRIFGRPASPRKAYSQLLQNRQRSEDNRIPRIRKTRRMRNPISGAVLIDRFDLLAQPIQRPSRDAHVISRMITNFEPIPVQLRNLRPRHVILLIRAKPKTLANKERRAKS